MNINDDIQISLGNCNRLLKMLKSSSIDMIFTDPQYGINYVSGHNQNNARDGIDKTVRSKKYFGKIQGDDEDVPVLWLKDAYRVLKDKSAMYVFLHWSKWSILEHACKSVGFIVKNMIVINKSNHGMGDMKGDYAPKHELLMYCTKGKHVLNRVNKRKNNVFDLPVMYSGAYHYHPNEKPQSWFEPFIEESSNIGDVILDPYMGSASLGIKCIDMHRRYIGYDIDEH